MKKKLKKTIRSLLMPGKLLSIAAALCIVFSCAGNKHAYKNELNILMPGNLQKNPAQIRILSSFKKKYPDINVIISSVPWNARSERLLTSIASGNAPDLCFLTGTEIKNWLRQEIFLDLNPFINNDPAFQEKIKEIYPQKLIQAGSLNKSVFALPIWQNITVTIYNRELFDREGLSYPGPGWEWENYTQAGRKMLKDDNNDGVIDQYGTILMKTWMAMLILPEQAGYPLIDPVEQKSLIDRPETAKIFDKYYSLYLKEKIVPVPGSGNVETSGQTSAEMFMTKKIGVLFAGHNEIAEFNNSPDLSWGIAPMLKIGKLRKTLNNMILAAVIKKGRNNENGVKFIKHMLSDISQKALPIAADMPVIKSAMYSDDFLNRHTSRQNKNIFIEALPDSIIWPDRLTSEIFHSIGKHIELAIAGSITFTQACAAAAKEVNDLLNERK
ncbi:MAG TPA: hypothetical protein DC049_17970 [Spirochaetia bacterium]|nr:hypothetical protein [Spirochaetia bacterium]